MSAYANFWPMSALVLQSILLFFALVFFDELALLDGMCLAMYGALVWLCVLLIRKHQGHLTRIGVLARIWCMRINWLPLVVVFWVATFGFDSTANQDNAVLVFGWIGLLPFAFLVSFEATGPEDADCVEPTVTDAQKREDGAGKIVDE